MDEMTLAHPLAELDAQARGYLEQSKAASTRRADPIGRRTVFYQVG